MEKKTRKELQRDQDKYDLIKMIPELIYEILGPEEELVKGTLTNHDKTISVFFIHFERRHEQQIHDLCVDLYDLSPNIVDYTFGLHNVEIRIS